MWSLAADPRLCGEVMHELWAVCGVGVAFDYDYFD